MEKGEAPSEEIEREWEKMIRNEERKSKDLANAAMVQLLFIQNRLVVAVAGTWLLQYV